MCPKILKIMLVDVYNASIIFKCLYMPIILILCCHNLPKPKGHGQGETVPKIMHDCKNIACTPLD